jgi:hypothetical protein
MTPPHAPPEAPARPIIFLLGPPAAGKTALGSCAYRDLGLDSSTSPPRPWRDLPTPTETRT